MMAVVATVPVPAPLLRLRRACPTQSKLVLLVYRRMRSEQLRGPERDLVEIHSTEAVRHKHHRGLRRQ